jgi:hypothetical protein
LDSSPRAADAHIIRKGLKAAEFSTWRRHAGRSTAGQSVLSVVAAPEIIIDVSPETPMDEYEANEVAADLKYKGKIVRMEGAVKSMGTDLMKELYVSINAGKGFTSGQSPPGDQRP